MRAARRGAAAAEDNSERWLTTYADAVTLLMAFFVMLYAISQVDQQKFDAFVSGLEVPFDNTASGGVGVLPENTSIVGEQGHHRDPDGKGTLAPPPVVAPGLPVDATAEAAPPAQNPATAPAGATAGDPQLTAVRDALQAALATAGLPDVASYRFEERGLAVSIGTEGVLFDTGSTDISPTGERIVATIAQVLGAYPNTVVVEGHTDDVPLSRSGYTNWNLSTDRAVSVLSALVAQHGLPPTRLGAAGYGEYRPLVPNDSPANRAINRRVDVLVVAQGGATDG